MHEIGQGVDRQMIYLINWKIALVRLGYMSCLQESSR